MDDLEANLPYILTELYDGEITDIELNFLAKATDMECEDLEVMLTKLNSDRLIDLWLPKENLLIYKIL